MMDTNHTKSFLLVSVVIPTHNRASQLANTLQALKRQTLPAENFEVVVVADGCTDETPQVVGELLNGLQLRFRAQPAQGPAAARNLGARQAQSRLLIFIDDDIEVVPGFLEAHLAAQRTLPDGKGVVVGYLPATVHNQQGFFARELHEWWEAMFQKLRQPGRRFEYSDLTSGNFSVAKELFLKVGGIDPALRCHEDYELGVRLLNAGAHFAFSDAAAGNHHEWTGVERSMQRKFAEGQADVQLGMLYPDLRPTLLMARLEKYALLPTRILKVLAFEWPSAGDHLVRWLQGLLALFDRKGLYFTWQRLLYGLMGYWYWRGVASQLKTRRAVHDFLAERPVEIRDLPEIDLAQGLDAAEQRLEALNPRGVQIRYGGQVVGVVPPLAGTEHLRAAHLRPVLGRELAPGLLKALALENAAALPANSPDVKARLLNLCDITLRQIAGKA